MIGLFGTVKVISALTVILSPAGTWIFWYPMLDSVIYVVFKSLSRVWPDSNNSNLIGMYDLCITKKVTHAIRPTTALLALWRSLCSAYHTLFKQSPNR